ncbi:MAG: glycoside hydrolase family 3 protein, partial [Pseudomonadales bacterium]
MGKGIYAAVLGCLLSPGLYGEEKVQPWRDLEASPEARAEALLGALSLSQKFQQLVGNAPEIVPELPDCLGGRHVRGIEALGLPTLRITNGPVGIGQNDCVDAALLTPTMPRIVPYTHPSSAKATALPSAMAIAATFDPEAADRFGQVIAAEAKALALHVCEAPGVNLARIPVLGRNFEYFGEDPFLTGTQAVAQIRRIQGEGIIAMAKHFAANEQETNRFNLSQTVEEGVLRELYLLPFEMAVKDGEVASLMCSYNDLNGLQACENPWLLTEVLRNDWGFKGYVQSDFFAVKSTAASMKAGLDHLMPMPLQWAPDKLAAALEAGTLAEADLDQALQRRYTQQFRLGVDQRPVVQRPLDVEGGGRVARDLGAAGAVLLQNNGALPLPESVKSLVLIGKESQVYAQQAVAGGVVVGKPMGAGGGSSDVVPHYTVSPLSGLEGALEGFGLGGRVSLFLIDDANGNLAPALEAARAADAVI